MSIKTCCYKCEERHDLCHSHCKKYAEFVEWNNKRKAMRRKYKDFDNYKYDVTRERRIEQGH
jgi:hypothetical protein